MSYENESVFKELTQTHKYYLWLIYASMITST